MEQASGRLRTALIEIGLPFVAHTKEQFEKEAAGPSDPAARRARRMMAAYEARNEPRQIAVSGAGGAVRGRTRRWWGWAERPGRRYAGNIRKSLHKNDVAVALNANEGSVVALGSNGGGNEFAMVLLRRANRVNNGSGSTSGRGGGSGEHDGVRPSGTVHCARRKSGCWMRSQRAWKRSGRRVEDGRGTATRLGAEHDCAVQDREFSRSGAPL